MASFSAPCPKVSPLCAALKEIPKPSHQHLSTAFNSSSQALFAGSSLRAQGNKHKHSDVFKVYAQINEVAIKTSLNSAPVPEKQSEEPLIEAPVDKTIPDAASISTFLSQVADLVELVDSRDITELQLKQQGLELSIKKKEAFQPDAAPMVMMQLHPQAMMPPQMAPTPSNAPAASPASSAPASPPALPSPSKPKSSRPPLKCPMAGTFYRAPAPGAPPFVKVGDKVKKGQVVCIIEAMKLMNEIESDQSGTVVEVVAEDGKPVSVDTPLFIIEP